jgi:DNA mismatch endonuclease (patch repair protein)
VADSVSPETRSRIMSAIRSKDTGSEMAVRRMAFALGYRYRLHAKDLPGKPDLVFRSRRKVVFVHGCFWHQHGDCRDGRIPASKQRYWRPKLAHNVKRDAESVARLKADGWKVLIVWECQAKNEKWLSRRLKAFLGSGKSSI